jgi:catechol 2,3-dioxygenase-like lactoylglutathione lyase family enzyme
MKMHLNLGAHDLERSVAFYQRLLGAVPVKHYDDYALFVTEDPGLELALDANPEPEVGRSNHYGVVVDSFEAVQAALKRLAGAGFATEVENDGTCCYARQTKVWATDPDGRRWETYVVHEDTEERDDESTCCTTPSVRD